MFCKKCGNPLKEGAKFCGACGTVVALPEVLASSLFGSRTVCLQTKYQQGHCIQRIIYGENKSTWKHTAFKMPRNYLALSTYDPKFFLFMGYNE